MSTRRAAVVLVLMLGCGACAAPGTRAPDVAPPSAPPVTPDPPKAVPPIAAAVDAGATIPPRAREAPPTAPAFWSRVRDGYRFAECEAPPVVRAREAYRRSAARTRDSIVRALPLMELVLEAIERRGLPTEFLFLPMIESGYAPVAGRGAAPAGMWQIVPVTARGLGLAMDARYDARLDTVAATEAALDLVDRLAARFGGDWRLATMAYNAGEFRVRRALAGHDRTQVATLALPAVTHAHLARLQGLACHAREVDLPEPDPDRSLERIVVEAPLDLALAAALAGVSYDRFRRDNAAHRDGVVARGRTVLVPRSARARFDALLGALPPARRVHWRTAPRAAAIASPSLDAALLARINEGASDAAWLVPDRNPRPRVVAAAPGATHRVAPGDSLWIIARRYGTTIARLRAWNGLDERAVLRPGDVLRIAAPRSR